MLSFVCRFLYLRFSCRTQSCRLPSAMSSTTINGLSERSLNAVHSKCTHSEWTALTDFSFVVHVPSYASPVMESHIRTQSYLLPWDKSSTSTTVNGLVNLVSIAVRYKGLTLTNEMVHDLRLLTYNEIKQSLLRCFFFFYLLTFRIDNAARSPTFI
jgi:hypothetical protein